MQQVPLFLQPLVKYVDFKGRARRSEFWLWTLAQFILFIALDAVLFTVAAGSGGPEQMATGFARFSPLLNLVQLGLLLPNLAVQVRRLHDTNRTGWWMVMPLGVFLAGLIIFIATNAGKFAELFSHPSASPDAGAIMSVVGGAMLLIWLPTMIAGIVIFVFNVLDGTPGMNRFGPDPKGRGGDVNVF